MGKSEISAASLQDALHCMSHVWHHQVMDSRSIIQVPAILNVKYTPLKDVLKDAGFRDLMKLAKDDEFRYGGLIPKVSAKGLEIIVYAKTRFLLSDLVTWTWDKRTKMSLGRYFLVSQEINSFS